MRIAVVHNLPPGGAHRRLACQVAHLTGEIVEICLQTATPVTTAPVVVPLRPSAPTRHRLLRPPLRYLDLIALEHAWRRATQAIWASRADVIYLNPCRFAQAPPVLSHTVAPAVYFCDEPRRVDAEPEVRATRNSLTNPLYAAIYARARRLDRATTAKAACVATNSHYTASEIKRVYGRDATVVRLGVAESLLQATHVAPPGRFLLSVGALVPTKGHDLVLRAASVIACRRPLQIVAPRSAPAEEARLHALARQHGVALSIAVGITDRELAGLYGAAHATLYLAEREPLGLASIEAQACGCPVIVADEGGLPETIVDGRTGWKVRRDASAAAQVVDRLEQHALREEMSAAARRHAKTWTWGASVAQVHGLLTEASEARPRDPVR